LEPDAVEDAGGRRRRVTERRTAEEDGRVLDVGEDRAGHDPVGLVRHDCHVGAGAGELDAVPAVPLVDIEGRPVVPAGEGPTTQRHG
jgi:hypothetical protein